MGGGRHGQRKSRMVVSEVRDAIREKVPVPPEKDFDLSAKQAEMVIMTKRNWSARALTE